MFRYDGEQSLTPDLLLKEQDGYSQFRAFQTGEIYGCNVRTTRFYEESPFRPDWLLGDFIQILHPGIKGVAPLRYYRKLQQLLNLSLQILDLCCAFYKIITTINNK